MSVITIQIRGINMTRRRNGEELSDPVSELEEGDGEARVVVAHFDASHHVRLLPAESVFELGRVEAQEVRESGLAIADGAAARLGGHLAEPDQQDEGERGRRNPSERLRARLREREADGLRAWLEELAREAAEAVEPVELFTARRVPGGWLRIRLRALGPRLHLRATLRPAPERASSSSPRFARAPGHAPGLVLEARAHLEPDGALRDIDAGAAADGLPEPPADLKAALAVLEGSAPEALAAGLDRLSERHPTATAQLVLARLAEIESVDLQASAGGTAAAPVFGELVAAVETAETVETVETSGRLHLDWTDEDQPVLSPASERLGERALARDLERIERLLAVLGAKIEEEDAA